MTPLEKRRWVIVAEEDMLPATTGGRIDADGFVCAAVAAGITVLLIVPGRQSDPEPYLRRYPGIDVVHLPRNENPLLQLRALPYVVSSRPPSAVADAAVRVFRPDAVFALSVRSAALGLRWATTGGVPLAVRCANRDSDYFSDLAASTAGLRSVAYRAEAVRMRRFERLIDTGGDVTLFADISDTEAAGHRRRTATPVLCVPTPMPGLDVSDGSPPPARQPGTVVFTGSLDVEINQLAVEWLAGQVWPLVLAGFPTARLQVVGRAPGPRVRRAVAARPRIELHPDVPDIAPYLATASVAVNPVQTGTGVNMKLLQSVLAGCASVSTRVGATGLDWEAGRHLLVAAGAPEFAGHILTLLNDPGLAAGIGAAGAQWARRRVDPRQHIEAVAAHLDGQPKSDL